MQQIQDQPSKWPTRLRVIGFLLALLILIVGATIWALNSLNSLPALFSTIFGALAAIIAFIQLKPIVFPQKSSAPAQSSQPPSTAQPINIYNVLPSSHSAPPAVTPAPPEPDQPTNAPSRSGSLTLRAFPLPTDSRSIQQRESYAERKRRAGREPFQREPTLLRINENTTFLELAANLFTTNALLGDERLLRHHALSRRLTYG